VYRLAKLKDITKKWQPRLLSTFRPSSASGVYLPLSFFHHSDPLFNFPFSAVEFAPPTIFHPIPFLCFDSKGIRGGNPHEIVVFKI